MLPQRGDQDIRQRDIAASGLGLRRLEADARLRLLQRLADLNYLGVKVYSVPAQRQHLSEPCTREQRLWRGRAGGSRAAWPQGRARLAR
jgi:hypothetical protein